MQDHKINILEEPKKTMLFANVEREKTLTPVSQKGGQGCMLSVEKLTNFIVSLFYHQSINHYWFYAWTFEKQYFLLLYMYMCRA